MGRPVSGERAVKVLPPSSGEEGRLMNLTIEEARDLAHRVMRRLGHDEVEAAIIADHLIDCELRGIGYGGLARAVSIAERLGRTGDRRRPIAIVHETPVSARLDGGDQI